MYHDCITKKNYYFQNKMKEDFQLQLQLKVFGSGGGT